MTNITNHTHDAGADLDYHALLGHIMGTFAANMERSELPTLFTTDADPSAMWDAYLLNLPEDQRQVHNCNACRRFIKAYGGLVTIDSNGLTTPAMWSHHGATAPYGPALQALFALVVKARVTGVHLSKLPVYGHPVTGEWHHMAVTPPQRVVYYNPTKTAVQRMAELREDYNTLARALWSFKKDTLDQAVAILQGEHVYRAEKVLGMATWLKGLNDRLAGMKDSRQRTAACWHAVAWAPAGFCHPRSAMIGTLLDDLDAGMPFTEVKRRFDEKMHPLRYQRPQAAPKAGNIAQAEKLVAGMGLESALRRRFCRLDEVKALWRPLPVGHTAPGGVFGHLLPKEEKRALELPEQRITWEKFQRTVLPHALNLEVWVGAFANFITMTTAADPAAPPILQWDSPEDRNPVAWFFYDVQPAAEQFNLPRFAYAKVAAVCLHPTMWGDRPMEHQGKAVNFLLEGCRNLRPNVPLALFPESMKAELRSVRATIEAFSNGGTLEQVDGPHAAGVTLEASNTDSKHGVKVRVTTTAGRSVYLLDRWD